MDPTVELALGAMVFAPASFLLDPSPRAILGTLALQLLWLAVIGLLTLAIVQYLTTVLTIDWKPDNVYIPSAPSTVSTFVSAAISVLEKLKQLDVDTTLANLNRLLVTANARIDAINSKGISDRTERVLGKVEKVLDGVDAKRLSDESVALLTELRESNVELKKTLSNPALQKLPDDAAAAIARIRVIVDDPNLPKTLAHLSRTLGRIDRILGGVESERNLQLLESLCETMLQGSLCGLGGMTPFPVQSALKHFREDFRARTRPLKQAG